MSTTLTATTEAAAHALGAYGGKGARAPPAHVVETPDDAAVVAHKQWASELEAHVLASLGDSAEQLLLIGDHQQLR